MEYYKNVLPELLSLYQQLIQCWSEIFDRRREVVALDNMNFSRNMFQQPLDMAKILSVFPFEPGYFSPDASSELDQLVRYAEGARLKRLAPARAREIESIVSAAGVGFGNGTTNVVFNIVRSLIELFGNENGKPNIIVALPNYPVYYSQLLSLSVDVRVVSCLESNHFLPTADEVAALSDDKTLAVIVTYPGNPAQYSYSEDGVSPSELVEIFNSCKARGAYLIVDNIYREMVWDGLQPWFELSLNVPDAQNWFIAYGPSKDTPFMSGFRMGYWLGDPVITDKYRELVSSSENCLNSFSVLAFALFLLFQGKGQGQLRAEEVELLTNGCLGWSVRVDPVELLSVINGNQLFTDFVRVRKESMATQKRGLSEVMAYLKESELFAPAHNGNIGNLILTGVKRDFFKGDSMSLFKMLLEEVGVGVLPGQVFGIQEIYGDYVPFRMTLVSEPPQNIIAQLDRVETYLRKSAWKK